MLFCRFDYSTNRREMRHRHRYRCYQSVQWFDTKYAERVANWILPKSVRRVRPFHRMKGGPSQRAISTGHLNGPSKRAVSTGHLNGHLNVLYKPPGDTYTFSLIRRGRHASTVSNPFRKYSPCPGRLYRTIH